MPDPTKKPTKKRDLATPLGESRFDPADYNRDGVVSTSESREHNIQKLKQKGTESLKDRQARRVKASRETKRDRYNEKYGYPDTNRKNRKKN